MILTLGDSFTVKRFKGDKPWPEHLAETLGKELMNISHEGETNHYTDFLKRHMPRAALRDPLSQDNRLFHAQMCCPCGIRAEHEGGNHADAYRCVPMSAMILSN